jgi:hypothetical protein
VVAKPPPQPGLSRDLAMADLKTTFRATLHDYCVLMENIKFRTSLMLDLTKNQRGLPIFCVAELLQLQIRMICETLAVACLVAHRNLEGTQSSRLRSAYQADLIMNALEKLHPRFFPRPTEQILKDGKPAGIRDIKDGFLTKQELLKSYHHAPNYSTREI